MMRTQKGYRDADWPVKRILVASPADDSVAYVEQLGNHRVISVVGEKPDSPGTKWFHRDDFERIAELIHSEIQSLQCQPIY